jgi:hypothetical protein
MTNGIFYGLIALSVTLTLSYLSKATNKTVARTEHGQYLLRMHKLYNVVGIISLVIAAVFLIAPVISGDVKPMFYVIGFVMLLLFGGLGLLSVLYFKKHWVLFDETKLDVCGPFNKQKSIYWNDIVKTGFNPSTGLVTLRTKSGEKVRVHYHLVGFSTFVRYLESKTRLTVRIPQ